MMSILAYLLGCSWFVISVQCSAVILVASPQTTAEYISDFLLFLGRGMLPFFSCLISC